MCYQELVIDIDESNHNEFLNNELAVIHFFSDWQMNCLTTLPLIEDIASEFSEYDLSFGKINVDDFQDFAKIYKITKVPCIVFLRNGEPVDKLDQIQEDLLREKISALIKVC